MLGSNSYVPNMWIVLGGDGEEDNGNGDNICGDGLGIGMGL